MANEKAMLRIKKIAESVKNLSNGELSEIVRDYPQLRKSPSGYHLGQHAMSEILRRSDEKLGRYSDKAQGYCKDYLLSDNIIPEIGICGNCGLNSKPECPYDGLPLPFLDVLIEVS